jgi:hypothetical protein
VEAVTSDNKFKAMIMALRKRLERLDQIALHYSVHTGWIHTAPRICLARQLLNVPLMGVDNSAFAKSNTLLMLFKKTVSPSPSRDKWQYWLATSACSLKEPRRSS